MKQEQIKKDSVQIDTGDGKGKAAGMTMMQAHNLVFVIAAVKK